MTASHLNPLGICCMAFGAYVMVYSVIADAFVDESVFPASREDKERAGAPTSRARAIHFVVGLVIAGYGLYAVLTH